MHDRGRGLGDGWGGSLPGTRAAELSGHVCLVTLCPGR
jgi:hypothetical protein